MSQNMSHMNIYSHLNATELTPIYKKAGKLQGGDAVRINIKASFSSNLSAVCLLISCSVCCLTLAIKLILQINVIFYICFYIQTLETGTVLCQILAYLFIWTAVYL